MRSQAEGFGGGAAAYMQVPIHFHHLLQLMTLYDVIWYYTMLYNIIRCYSILYDVIQFYTIVYDVIRYYTILYDVIQYYTKLKDQNSNRDFGASKKEACKACEGDSADCFYAGDLRFCNFQEDVGVAV